MKVLLVDDQILFAEGLRRLLEARGMEVTGRMVDVQEALPHMRARTPDVLLVSVTQAGCADLDGLRQIKAEFPKVHLVLLTGKTDGADLFTAIQCGASGYIPKSIPVQDFFTLLTGIVKGETNVPRPMIDSRREAWHAAAFN